MARYSRPSTTRTYKAIQADISEATAALAHNEGDAAEFWRRQAEGCERLVSLWNEIVWQAVDDLKLPAWTRFAAMTTRDYYAKLINDAPRSAGAAVTGKAEETAEGIDPQDQPGWANLSVEEKGRVKAAWFNAQGKDMCPVCLAPRLDGVCNWCPKARP